MSQRSPTFGKVSVIMPTYNSARTVDRAMDSLFAQTYSHWQLILVDDGSTDATIDRIAVRRRGQEDRIVLIRCEINGGPAAARNRGLAVSDGEWIAVLDSDDAWRPDRLRILLGQATETAADAICDNLLGFDDHVGKETTPLYARLPPSLDIVAAVAPTYTGLYNLGYLKPVIRREFVDRHQIRYDETLRTGEDQLYLLELLLHRARVICVAQTLYLYTTQVGDMSGKLSQSTKSAPRDADMARSLERLRNRSDGLTEAERQAIDLRIAYLRDIAPVAEFRYARLTGNWLKAAKLVLTSAHVRRRIFNTIRLK